MHGQQKKLFVVDDDPGMLCALRRILECEGYVVLTFEGAQGVLESVVQERPVLIISDSRMPGKHGLTLLRKIRAKFPSIRTVLLTADVITDEIQQAVSSGVIDLLALKPCDTAKLIRRIRELTTSGPGT